LTIDNLYNSGRRYVSIAITDNLQNWRVPRQAIGYISPDLSFRLMFSAAIYEKR